MKSTYEREMESPEFREQYEASESASEKLQEQADIMLLQEQYNRAFNLLHRSLKCPQKAVRWLETCNPLLGNQVPADMIMQGRFDKLMKFIRVQLEENKVTMDNVQKASIQAFLDDIKAILNEDTNKNKDAQNGSDRTYKTHNE